MKENEILEKLKENKIEYFEKIMDLYSKRLFAVIYRFVNNYEDTEDLMQEVWLKFYKKIKSFRGECSLYTFLYRIAVNLCINHLKRKKLAEKIKKFLPFKSFSSDPAEKIFQDEELKILKEGIELLPAKQKSVFILRHQENISFKEISQILKITENSAKVNYHYAVKNLKKFFISKGIKL